MAKSLKGLRLSDATLDLLNKLAELDERSHSYIVEKAVAEYAKQKGLTDDSTPKPTQKKKP